VFDSVWSHSGSTRTDPCTRTSGMSHSYIVRGSCRLLGSSTMVCHWWMPPRWWHSWTGGVQRPTCSTFRLARSRWCCRTSPWSLVFPSMALLFVGWCLLPGGGTPLDRPLAFYPLTSQWIRRIRRRWACILGDSQLTSSPASILPLCTASKDDPLFSANHILKEVLHLSRHWAKRCSQRGCFYLSVS
jgi:hypothetical protein